MAKKKTYVYRMLIGSNDNVAVDTFLYARNADVAKQFCKELYKDKKYDHYQAIKVGIAHNLQETQILSDYEIDKLKNSIASQGDKYAEREVETPKFITVEEAGELGL